MLTYVSIFFIFLFGLFIGSFLNVLIDRLPRNEKITGRSYCENCKKTLSWKDLIPVISFVYLHGRCRYCKTKLSPNYPLVELVTGVMFVLTYLIIFNFQFSIFNEIINFKSLIINLFYYLLIASCMIVVFFADLKHGIIPDKIILSGILVSILYLLFSANPSSIFYNLFSGLGGFGFMLFLFLITKGRGMGFGDVKLSFLMGLVLGYPGVFYSIYLAFLTGGIFAIILVLWRKRKLKSQIPFGPFLVGNFLLVLYFQPQINSFTQSLIS